jgi:hypothetical protein
MSNILIVGERNCVLRKMLKKAGHDVYLVNAFSGVMNFLQENREVHAVVWLPVIDRVKISRDYINEIQYHFSSVVNIGVYNGDGSAEILLNADCEDVFPLNYSVEGIGRVLSNP